MYKPNPIDTSKIELPEDLLELTQRRLRKMSMKTGLQGVSLMDGHMEKREMMRKKQLYV